MCCMGQLRPTQIKTLSKFEGFVTRRNTYVLHVATQTDSDLNL